MAGIIIDSIASLIAYSYDLAAHCHGCHHSASLDLAALGARLGLDHSALHDALAPKLRCGRCGGKDVGLILSPGGQAQVGYTSRY